uniref:Potassium/proton antiporter CemA n=1 Tax=Koliella corcontica TaxID=155904 RepID=A0A097KMS1_9CHLO|nr:chloroplast enveloppe membrane protein [Koliella corcontica]AIT94470.1 chloroplast enveloppe membrane protein [Koliella corcontica]
MLEEEIGLIPRSIIRTFDRFLKQISPQGKELFLQEFRISRYRVQVSFKCFLILIISPLLINFILRAFVLTPIITFYWNNFSNEIFLNSYQQKRILLKMEKFEDQLFFDSLISNKSNNFDLDSEKLKKKFQQKTLVLAKESNKESIKAITNTFTDFLTLLFIVFLFRIMKVQISILKSFLLESIFGLSDTNKSFLIIILTDLLVGYHSPRGWELFLQMLLQRFGFPENQEFILMLTASVPVLLDTVFKYWIFRYLNRISPSTVATYHTMIE